MKTTTLSGADTKAVAQKIPLKKAATPDVRFKQLTERIRRRHSCKAGYINKDLIESKVKSKRRSGGDGWKITTLGSLIQTKVFRVGINQIPIIEWI